MSTKKVAKRAATIVCDCNMSLAILHKNAFNKSIKAALERKINMRVEFLKNFRLADGITRATLVKLT